MITAAGIEMSQDTEVVSVAVAGRPDGARKYQVDLVYYGPPSGGVAAAVAACEDEDSAGLHADPAQVAGLLGDLRFQGVWLHLLEATDVAAAAFAFKQAVRERRVRTSGHEALKSAMTYATRRPLAAAFAFERRRVAVDMSALNAACFAFYGLRQNEAAQDPGVWVLGGQEDDAGLMARLRAQTEAAGMPLPPEMQFPPGL
jgi:hypothetical protein